MEACLHILKAAPALMKAGVPVIGAGMYTGLQKDLKRTAWNKGLHVSWDNRVHPWDAVGLQAS